MRVVNKLSIPVVNYTLVSSLNMVRRASSLKLDLFFSVGYRKPQASDLGCLKAPLFGAPFQSFPVEILSLKCKIWYLILYTYTKGSIYLISIINSEI
jgi:hypothetical protein